jgi:hypothetical protein
MHAGTKKRSSGAGKEPSLAIAARGCGAARELQHERDTMTTLLEPPTILAGGKPPQPFEQDAPADAEPEEEEG